MRRWFVEFHLPEDAVGVDLAERSGLTGEGEAIVMNAVLALGGSSFSLLMSEEEEENADG